MTEHRVIALGFFDGVHLGHAQLLKKTCEIANRLGAVSTVLSFDVSPAALIGEKPIAQINTVEERIEIIKNRFHIREVIIEHFDRDFMRIPWQSFVDNILIAKYHAAYVVCGHDYRFGNGGEGTCKKLFDYCKSKNIGCDIINKVELDGLTVSSTNIRRFFQEGDFSKAVTFLGHPHLISGTVQKGKQNGRQLGFPTANIPLSDGIIVPPFGVYFALAEISGTQYPCVCNIGIHPTVDRLCVPISETHILGFDENLYGQKLTIRLHAFHRQERTFSSLEELGKQLALDCKACLSFFKEKHLDA